MSRMGRDGYSFIEMLTAIVVLGLILVITVVSMAPAVQRGRVRNALNMVSGDLQAAQSLAVRHRRPMVLLVQSSTKQYQIRDRDSSTAVYIRRALGADTEFGLDTLSVSTDDPVEIFPNGVTHQTITVTLGIEGYLREVRLSRAGQISKIPF